MSDKKHIDRLFQESFKDFEATPSDAVWQNIEANLNKKKKRRVIPIWWRYAGVAALLLLLLTIGGSFFNNSKDIDPVQIVDTKNADTNIEEKNSNNSSSKTVVISSSEEENSVVNNIENKEQISNTIVTPQDKTSIAEETSRERNKNKSKLDKKPENNSSNKKNNHFIAKNIQKNNKTEKVQDNSNTTNNVATAITIDKTKDNLLQIESSNTKDKNATIPQTKNNITQDKEKVLIADNKEKKNELTIEEAIDKNKDILEKNKKTNRWSVAPNAAPVYFNTLGNGSSIDPQFNNNSKSGEVNISYGVSASYAINNRLSVRSGINKVNLGYNTNDVVIFQTTGIASASALRNVNESSFSSDSQSLVSETSLSNLPESLNTINTTLNQAFGYIEVPVEIQYALLNKKFGVNVIGGFSSFFLNNNEIYSETDNGTRTFLGEANNLNKLSYSANFGLGFNYKFTEKLDLNLEPMFKYQINTFNNTSGNFKPFIIGVYTGFSIKF